MDNLSHSVVGLAAGELIHRALPEDPDPQRSALRRRLLLWTCWIASNLPDLDIVLTPLLPAPLGYLLHHRGHTHTVLYLLPQMLLIWAMIWVLVPPARRLLKENAHARKGFALALVLGLGLHLAMDYLNSYGIHPFHPVDSRWYFGDMVFILEPWFWTAFGVPFAMTIRRLWLRMLLLAALIVLPLFFTVQGYLLWTSFAAIVILALALGRAQHAAGVRGMTALVLAAIIGLGFVGVQGFASHQAGQAVVRTLNDKDPAGALLDTALTPFPTNPLCWMFVSIESNEQANSYRLRRGLLSLAPGILPVAACPARFSARFSTDAERRETTPEIAFLEEEQGDLRMLRELKSSNCYMAAWLRFARMPWVSENEASDLRFASSMRGNFTTMRFADLPCPRHVPGWGFPREDLLAAPSAK